MKAISALSPSKSVKTEEIIIQKIYDSVRNRKNLKMNVTVLDRSGILTRTCSSWQSEKTVEKLNRSSWLVKFCWFGIIAQAGRFECTAVKSEGIKSIILVSCRVHASKFYHRLPKLKIRGVCDSLCM